MFVTSEGLVDKFPSPEELWIKTFKDKMNGLVSSILLILSHSKEQESQDIIKKLQLIMLLML